MAVESEKTTTIQSVWAQRCAEDLAANRERQSGIDAQISELQEQRAQLQQEEAWLVERQKSLSVPSAPGDQIEHADDVSAGKPTQEAAAGDDAVASSVPQPRQEAAKPAKKRAAAKAGTAAQEGIGKAVAAKKASTTPKKSPGKKAPAAQKTTAKKTTAKPATDETTAAKKSAARPLTAKKTGTAKQEPLQSLILAIVSASAEPRLAREVFDELAEQHPDRATSVQTVRNTLEALVKKQSIEKSNQQGSVMYCAKKSPADAPTADTQPAQVSFREPAQV
ncbi:hypothetical protein ACF1AB_40920 [Streptomyces sp. NPDC014846]|uniref:hypothetical protein n=1 Tax=Streptomyces sp. NPDC014846 TaxID=3364922 RepID=UPI0036F5EF8B